MRKHLILVVTLALICRLAVYATVTRHDHLSTTTPFAFTNIDSPTYDRLGLNLATHGVYSESADRAALAPAAERGPGYPALIALVYRLLGHRPQAVLLLQIILGSLTAGLVCLIGHRLAGPVAGLAGGLLLALDLPSIIYANLFLTESLAALINLVAVWTLALAWRSSGRRTTLLLLATGALAALSAYVRTAALLWPLGLAACTALYYWRASKRLSLTSPACLLAAYFLVLTPWVVRNSLVFGAPQFSSGAGNCLLLFNASAVVAARDGITQDQAIDRMGDEVRA
ncbi:MAG: glycosyltransferase family 39 protein, partial [Armatimonadia bacterium]